LDARFSFPLDALKIFRTAGRGPRNRVDDREGNDGRFTHCIATRDPLFQRLPTLTPAEFAGRELVNTKIKLGITPYYFKLINPADEHCVICRPLIPRLAETPTASDKTRGACSDDDRVVIRNFERPDLEFIAGPVERARFTPSEEFIPPEPI
jgi:hypothetical protein